VGETARLTFRKLTIDDANICAALDFKSFGERDAWSSEDFFTAALNKNFEFIVAEKYGRIIACAGAEIYHDGTAEIDSIAVDADFRGQGIGKILLVKLLNAIIERGATFVVLEVRPSNAAAIKLYEGFGFEIVDREKNFYGDEDAWIMARDFERSNYDERDFSSNDD
jgi:ribosomal-protein-alanine N-acetyltransferase